MNDISLVSLIVIVLVRTVQHNLGHSQVPDSLISIPGPNLVPMPIPNIASITMLVPSVQSHLIPHVNNLATRIRIPT